MNNKNIPNPPNVKEIKYYKPKKKSKRKQKSIRCIHILKAEDIRSIKVFIQVNICGVSVQLNHQKILSIRA